MISEQVLVPDHVLDELKPIAEREQKELGNLVNEVLQQYIWQARERKIDREMEGYRAMHAELKQQFLGHYVAIHNGELVDHDSDRRALSRRVRQEYGSIAVLITPVEDTPEREFLVLTPRFRWDV